MQLTLTYINCSTFTMHAKGTVCCFIKRPTWNQHQTQYNTTVGKCERPITFTHVFSGGVMHDSKPPRLSIRPCVMGHLHSVTRVR
uniref:Uncharacterized protein n=1 Tax=Anguilla anguilla TaxID=7936 RepID=A0A0E9X0Z9_ANGAN